ncbi:S41 family peptidase [Pedobacter sp. SYSU D00535]|uniref:S41 family peptidase n=1 Tax=Pedobacter sp. SYSU D00535 TaxID=2810308 RepID=UPI001A97BD3F|nr:S41 family peptidase [Pedobacter sp. SYSU D00535]
MILHKASLRGLLLFLGIAALAACKKTPQGEEPQPQADGTRSELTKDSIFLYAKEVYYWNSSLPSYEQFNPRKYSDNSAEIDNLDEELYYLTRFGINPSTSRPFEFVSNSNGTDAGYPKYSYISDITQQNPTAYIPSKRSSVDLEGNGNDFGLRVGLFGTQSNYKILVQAVYPGSDAAAKGFKRGDTIKVINTRTVGSNYNSEVDFIDDALFSSSTVSLKGNRGVSATAFDLTLSKTSYKSSPIYKDAVITSGAKKIGYIAYARFSHLASNSKAELDRVFSSFVTQGVTDLIIDLRYNGGGYVATAEYLINTLAPTTLRDQIMFREHYNSQMQQGNAKILKNQPVRDVNDKPIYQNGKMQTYADQDYSLSGQTTLFKPRGVLSGINKIVFITTGSTASSSELVINSLKPHLSSNIKIVGSRSYGKPIGFFPLRIDKYDVFLSMFQTKNSAGYGDYFDGFTPDISASDISSSDKVVYDFGDSREKLLAAAVNYITTGTATATASVLSREVQLLDASGNPFGDHEFKGMVETRFQAK